VTGSGPAAFAAASNNDARILQNRKEQMPEEPSQGCKNGATLQSTRESSKTVLAHIAHAEEVSTLMPRIL
jgi:hypothetical protein